MADDELAKAIANADSIVVIGEPVVSKHDVIDTAAGIALRITTTRQLLQIHYPMDEKGQVAERRIGGRPGGGRGFAVGSASCTLICKLGDQSGCSYNGCTFDRAQGHCTPGDCGSCVLENCIEEIDAGKKGLAVRPV